jgi:hypothetical protein
MLKAQRMKARVGGAKKGSVAKSGKAAKRHGAR